MCHSTIILSGVTFTIVNQSSNMYMQHFPEINYQKSTKKDIGIIIPFHQNLMNNPIQVCIGG